MMAQPKCMVSVTRKWKRLCKVQGKLLGKSQGVPPPEKQGELLKRGIRLLLDCRSELKKSSLSLSGQPFDLHLLNSSLLYRRSRKTYLDQGGIFIPSLVSSPRTLGSSILLDQVIEYSPIENEFIWVATDQLESRDTGRLMMLRTYSSSLFHEQSHRILWKLLPSAPPTPSGIRKYLNLAESLVIVLDMALGDELGPDLAPLFYLSGVTYDPGTSVASELPKRRDYRNYLQAAFYATYLNLELFNPQEIPRVIEALFPNLGKFATRAAARALNLDRAFIENTNPCWQRKHYRSLIQRLCTRGSPVLELPENPMIHHQQYLLAEKWFDLMGL